MSEPLDETTDEAETPAEDGEPVELDPAELDGDEPDASDADEPEPPKPQAQGLTEREIEKRVERLEKEASRHAGRISEIMEEDAQDLVPCPLCAGPFVGFIFPDAAKNLRDEHRDAVKAAIGEASAGYMPAPHTAKCGTCNGKGDVLSGSTRPGSELVQCPRCKGRGYMESPTGEPVTAADSNGQVEPVAAVAAVETPPDRDPWGRPSIHPKFGVMPQFDPSYNAADFFPQESQAV